MDMAIRPHETDVVGGLVELRFEIAIGSCAASNRARSVVIGGTAVQNAS
jgi:hypothetical protein